MTIQEQLNELIFSLPCHAKGPYPDINQISPNKQIAKLVLDAFSNGNNAEFTAIAQYMHHSLTISNEYVKELELCIALVEMYHLQLLGRLIDQLGGDPRYIASNQHYWSGGNVSYGNSLCEKLSIDIASEQYAIFGYEALIRNIEKIEDPSNKLICELIRRIIADEKVHLQLFKNAYRIYCKDFN